MFLKSKFYDAGATEGAGGDTEVLEVPAQQETPSLASLMAKGGTKITSPELQPIDTTKSSEKQETKIDEKDEKPVVTTASQTENVENGQLETPKPKEEAKEETAKPPIEEAKTPQLSFQEVLKQQPKTEVLKALGVDDRVVGLLEGLDPKVVAFLETYKNGGDLKSYLREWTTDYSKMPSEEVMRHQLSREYPKASISQLNVLYKKEVVEKYNLNSDDPDELEEGKMLLDAKADRYRDEFVKNQSEKLLPPPQPKVAEPDNSQEIAAQQEFDAYKSKIESDPYSRNVFDKRQVIIGEGEDAFKFPIDPEATKNILYDSAKWTETQFDVVKNPDGTIKNLIPKVENQVLTAIFAQNPKKFLDDYAKHYKSVGGKEAIKPIENAKQTNVEKSTNAVKAPQTLAEAMAKGGQINTGVSY